MLQAPFLRIATLLLLCTLALNASDAQTKPKKATGTSDQTGSDDATDTSSDAKTDKSASSKDGDKAKADTSKTGFDDGTYAQATAISYKAMQSIAESIAKKKDQDIKTFVVFDPVTFANIAQYRITFPQVVLLRTNFCDALTEYDKATKKLGQPTGYTPEEASGASQSDSSGSGGIPALTPAGQIVDLAQKVLTMLQTTTTIAGASVNVTDEALVAEVASKLADTDISVYYPGEFLLPELGDNEIGPAMKDGCSGAPDFEHSLHIVPEIIRLGVARAKAAQRYQMVTAALDKYNAVVNPPAKKNDTDAGAQNNQTNTSANPNTAKKDKKPKLGAGGAPAAAPAPATNQANEHQPTDQEKAEALKKFHEETGFKDIVTATGFQTNLKACMDTYDALLTSLAVTDPKGQSLFSKLVIAERLNAILKASTTSDTKDKSKPVGPVSVVIVKWLRAGALNKTRKNLFFLGQRNYYAGGATALYEYFDGTQRVLASGTITETSPYVHDKDFDKGKMGKVVDLSAAKLDVVPKP
jgi:hypothetical protein